MAFSVAMALSSSLAPGFRMTAMSAATADGATCRNAARWCCAATPSPYTAHCRRLPSCSGHNTVGRSQHMKL